MKWTSAELARLRVMYLDHTAEECARRMGRSVSSIRNAAHLNGLRKSAEFLASERSGRIPKLAKTGEQHHTDKPMEIDRAKAIADVAQVIINSAKVEVDYIEATGAKGTGFVPQDSKPRLVAK